MTVIENLQKEYLSLSRDVSALSYFVLIILAFSIARLVYLLYSQRYEDAASIFAVVGVLSSVLVVTKASTRTIAHSEIIRHYEESKDIAYRVHNIIGILHDINIRAAYCVESIKANDPTNSFLKNGIALEERFKELNDRVYSDLYDQEIYYCLRYMMSPIHWISVYCDQISSDESLPKDGLKSFFEKDFDILESSVSEIKKYSNKFDYEIRKKRQEASLYESQ